MKLQILTLNIFALAIVYVYSYLSSDEFRDIVEVKDDFSSVQFFGYFKLRLKYLDNNPKLYIKTCKEGNILGFLRQGNITQYFDYSNYGAIGIDLNAMIAKDYFSPQTGDELNFYLNGQKLNSLKLDTFNYPSSNITLCDRNMWIFNISLIYFNSNATTYPPLKFDVITNFSTHTDIDWAISNIQLHTVNCPEKCSVCSNQQCIGCAESTMMYKPSVCYCDPGQELSDYADATERINCQPNYINVLSEDYSLPFENSNWFWNNYSIVPFNFKKSCDKLNTTYFGGYKTFGDSDVLTKIVKLNNQNIVGKFQPVDNPYKFVSILYYKIDFSLGYFNWDDKNNLNNIKISPTSKQSPLELLISDPVESQCSIKENTFVIHQDYTFNGLYDNAKYCNITFVMPTNPSRSGNNFGLLKFKYSISPCFKTCLTCASPTMDSCQSCVDPNAELVNGQCLCKSGYIRDPFSTEYWCVNSVTKNVIQEGAVTSDIGYGSVIGNNMRISSYYCNRTRSIIGGYTVENLNTTDPAKSIDIVTSDVGIAAYLKRVTLELITEEDNSLIFPFAVKYNQKKETVTTFAIKKVKYLKYTDPLALLTSNCYDTVKYKHYQLQFYIRDKAIVTDITISNVKNSFWGILKATIDYFRCHANCNTCSEYGNDKCLSCKPGMILNSFTMNTTDQSSTCLCDTANGYFQTSAGNDPLVCTDGKSSIFKSYYLYDLDEENFEPKLWRNLYSQMSDNDIIICENSRILGKYSPEKLVSLEKTFNITSSLENFKYFQIDLNFILYFFKTFSNYVVKVYFDSQYVFGKYYIATAAESLDEKILCDEGSTIFYKKAINFTFINNGYFSTINTQSPTVRIEVIPDSECRYNSDCGWGISNLWFKVYKTLPNSNSTCLYKPYSTCQCASAVTPCNCFPGYYSNRFAFGEYKCQTCVPNCNSCTMPTKCAECLPGYTVVNSLCVPAKKALKNFQTSLLKIDMQRYFKSLIYPFEGFSVNFWMKSAEQITTLEKPLILVDPFLLTYNTTNVSFNLRFTKSNYLFPFSQRYALVIDYPVNPDNKTFYEGSWIPISMTFAYKNTHDFAQDWYTILMSVNNQPVRIGRYEIAGTPVQMTLFNYFSKISYRYVKLWDREIHPSILNMDNYVTAYSTTPPDLLLYYQFTEGYLINRGSSSLFYILNTKQFTWEYDLTAGPASCLENQYYSIIDGTCLYCHPVCKRCFGGDELSCNECNQPYSFYDIQSKQCTQICPKGLVANFKYPKSLSCSLSCPYECLECDNLAGCTKCREGYYLYGSTCVSSCTPAIALEEPAMCYKISSSCTPSVTILDKPEFFLLDNTNLKLMLNVTSCDQIVQLQWSSSIDAEDIILNNEGKTLLVDGKKLTIPGYQIFQVKMYDINETTELGSDYVYINFVGTTINGGQVLAFYMNDTFTFDVEYFDKYVAERMAYTTKQYIWSCPRWVPFDNCNPKINKPKISINGSNIINSGDFVYDSLQVLTMSAHIDKLTVNFTGYFVVYEEKNIFSYFAFEIFNVTKIGYNNLIKYQISFENSIEQRAMQEDIDIEWVINSTSIVPLNGNNLPSFIFRPTNDAYGTYSLTCNVIYKKGTPMENTITRSAVFTISPPLVGGTFSIFPQTGTSYSTIFTLSPFGYHQADTSSGSTALAYQYYYKNCFNEYIALEHLDDMTSKYSSNLIPPTTSILLRIYFDTDNYIEQAMDVKINPNPEIEFKKVITQLFNYDLDDSLRELEVLALNFRALPLEGYNMLEIGELFISKLKEMIEQNYQKDLNIDTIFQGLDKVGTIFEAVSYRVRSVAILNTIPQIITYLRDSASAYGRTDVFSEEQNNVHIRAYNNMLNFQIQSASVLQDVRSTYIDGVRHVLQYSMLDTEIGLEKKIFMDNVQIFGTQVNPNYIRNDLYYTFQMNSTDIRDHNEIILKPRADLFEKAASTVEHTLNTSVVITRELIGSLKENYIIEINRYPTLSTIDPTNLTLYEAENAKIQVTREVIDVMASKVVMALVTVQNSQEVSTTQIRSLQSSDNSTNSSYTVSTYIRKDFYPQSIITDSDTVTINFTLPIKFPESYMEFMTCIRLDDTNQLLDPQEATCNTWFDYERNVVQCQCDDVGMYTVIFNPDFKYLRREKQFTQLKATLGEPWGFGTIIFLFGIFILLMVYAYFKDKIELTNYNLSAGSESYFKDFREKIKSQMMSLKTVTFGSLFCQLFKHGNDFYSIRHYKDFFYLRTHRMLVLLFRIAVVIMFCLYKQNVNLDSETIRLVEKRDIKLKATRSIIYFWNGDWQTEMLNNIYYAIPIGIIMIFIPRLSEWLFRYPEEELIFVNHQTTMTRLYDRFYSRARNNCEQLMRDAHGRLTIYNNPSTLLLLSTQKQLEEIKRAADARKYLAYLNFQKMIFYVIQIDVNNSIFKAEKSDTLPQDIAPIFYKRLNAQLERYEERAYEIRNKLRYEELEEQEEKTNNIFVDMKKRAEALEQFEEGKIQIDKKEIVGKYAFQQLMGRDELNQRLQAVSEDKKKGEEGKKKEEDFKVEEKVNPTPLEEKPLEENENDQKNDIQRQQFRRRSTIYGLSLDKKQPEGVGVVPKRRKSKIQLQLEERQKGQEMFLDIIKEKDLMIEEQEREEDINQKKKEVLAKAKNLPNALIPELLYKNWWSKIFLLIKVSIIVAIMIVLIFNIAASITTVRNQGGNMKAVFWVILAAFALAENYLIFLPLMCFLKTLLIMKYHAYPAKRFVWAAKYFLYQLLVTDLDRGIYKEMHECVKNNSKMEEENMKKRQNERKEDRENVRFLGDDLDLSFQNNEEELKKKKEQSPEARRNDQSSEQVQLNVDGF